MRRFVTPEGYCADSDDDNIVPDMGLKTKWVWVYAAITLLVMGCLGCVMSAAGERHGPSVAPPTPKDTRQILTPDRKPVQRPVEGL